MFVEKTPLNAVHSSGEQIVSHLLISLCKSVESSVGFLTCRINLALKNHGTVHVQYRSLYSTVYYCIVQYL